MNINAYLPDELGRRAKEAGLNLSGLLREAVVAELERRDREALAAAGMGSLWRMVSGAPR
jgi:post-segregation antitoxin (ccd killing protein)